MEKYQKKNGFSARERDKIATNEKCRDEMQIYICASMSVRLHSSVIIRRKTNMWSSLQHSALTMPNHIILLERFSRGFFFQCHSHTWQKLPTNIHKTALPLSFSVLLSLPFLLLQISITVFSVWLTKDKYFFFQWALLWQKSSHSASPFEQAPLLPLWEVLSPFMISNLKCYVCQVILSVSLSTDCWAMPVKWAFHYPVPLHVLVTSSRANGPREDWAQLLPSHSSNLSYLILPLAESHHEAV